MVSSGGAWLSDDGACSNTESLVVGSEVLVGLLIAVHEEVL